MQDSLARVAGPAAITGTATLFTVDPSSTWSINSIVLANPSGIDVTVKLGINGITDDKLVLPPTKVLAGGTATFDSLLIFGAGDTLQANATSAITITVGGLKQS